MVPGIKGTVALSLEIICTYDCGVELSHISIDFIPHNPLHSCLRLRRYVAPVRGSCRRTRGVGKFGWTSITDRVGIPLCPESKDDASKRHMGNI
jgi:hypothetical protein